MTPQDVEHLRSVVNTGESLCKQIDALNQAAEVFGQTATRINCCFSSSNSRVDTLYVSSDDRTLVDQYHLNTSQVYDLKLLIARYLKEQAVQAELRLEALTANGS
jgi:hypothetical protein